jgi:hypothetical protein
MGAMQRRRDGIVEQTDDHQLHGVEESERVVAAAFAEVAVVAGSPSDSTGSVAAASAVAASAGTVAAASAVAASASASASVVVMRSGPLQVVADIEPSEEVNAQPRDVAMRHVEACTDHKKKRWVLAIYDATRCPDMRPLAEQLGVLGYPFLIAQAAAVAETVVVYQVPERETHKPKTQLEGCTARLTFVKKGNQVDKVCDTIDAVRAMAARTFGNLRVVRPVQPTSLLTARDPGEGDEEGELEGPMYDEILATVLGWGINKFVSHVENCRIRKAEKRELSVFDQRVLVVQNSLREAVRLFEDASDMVFKMETEQQKRAAPVPWEVGASAYAKGLLLYQWNNREQRLEEFTLSEWLDGGRFLTTSLLLMGEAAAGKSRLLHQLCQEVCVAVSGDTYIFGKSIDPLGVLSHAGTVRQASVLALTDFELAASRGKSLASESLKGLFDADEGGSLKDTRWRAAQLPGGMARVFALNGQESRYHGWFARHEQHGLAAMIEKLGEATAPGTAEMDRWRLKAETTRLLKGLGGDDQAVARRVAIGFCRESLLNEDAMQALRENTESRAAACRAARAAYWAARSA